jgi:hypothetical protein
MNPTESMNPDVLQPHTVELVQRAEIDMQISTARKYPRDLARTKKRMIEFATMDEDTAMACFYTLPRDGKKVQGPSVRLAEIAVSCYGNIRVATRIIDNDGRVITAQGVCHDLENNVMISVEVKRSILDKNGKQYKQDMQVTTGNAASAIALRNAVFKVIPGALVKPVYDQARAVAVGDAKTLNERRDKMLGAFSKMGVTKEMILRSVEKTSVENIGLDELGVLLGLFNAIREGDTTIEEAFAHGTSESPEEIARRKADELRAKGGKVQEIRKEDPPAEPTTSRAETKPTNQPETKPDAKPEPEKAAAAESTGNNNDGKADDSWLPDEIRNSEPATIKEPAYRTDIRNLKSKFVDLYRAGGSFNEILEKHGCGTIESVTAEKASAIIADCEDALSERKKAAAAEKGATPAPRGSRARKPLDVED